MLAGLAGLTALTIALAGCSSAPQAVQTPTPTSSTASSLPTSTPSSTPTTTSTPTTSKKTTTPKPAPRVVKAAPKLLVRDPLSGWSRSTNPIVAVKIDNTSGGRPQYGISKADVVYIEQVEGGLTRMMAIFHSHLPTEVGPVRSVRSTDVELLGAYGRPVLTFSGGAGGPLSMLAASRVIDASGAAGYWRSDRRVCAVQPARRSDHDRQVGGRARAAPRMSASRSR